MRITIALLTTVLGLGWTATAQHVISARSGVVQYTEGRVLADNKPVDTSLGHFMQLQENQQLDTEEGRAEVLLTPGVILRMGENSSVRLVSGKLTDTRVEILKGSAFLEANALSNESKDNAVTLLFKDATFAPLKNGLYRIDTDPARVRVYDGELLVRTPAGELRLKKGHFTMLEGTLVAGKFDPKADDDLYRWSSRRSGYMAEANVYSARSLTSGYYGYASTGGWVWNPYFGMFSWVPWNGLYYNAFGYAFWSPYSVYQSYYPYYYGYYPPSGGGSGYHRPTTPVAGASAGFRGSGGFQNGGGGGVVSEGRGSSGGNGGFRGGSGGSGGSSGGGFSSGGGGGMHAGSGGASAGSVVSAGGSGGGGHSGGGGGVHGH